MKAKTKFYSSLVFVLFLIGSTITYYELGRIATVGIVLQIFAIYILIKIDLISTIKTKDDLTSDKQ